MEGMEEADLDPDGKTLFDEGQRGVPLKQDEAYVHQVSLACCPGY